MRYVLRAGVFSLVPVLILLAQISTANDFGPRDVDADGSTEQWILTSDSSACRPDETGRVCAEWRSQTQSYGLTCCVSPAAIGSQDPGACEILINGELALLPDRDPID